MAFSGAMATAAETAIRNARHTPYFATKMKLNEPSYYGSERNSRSVMVQYLKAHALASMVKKKEKGIVAETRPF
jgi:hypothetical protein